MARSRTLRRCSTLAAAAVITTVSLPTAAKADSQYCGRPYQVLGAIQVKYDEMGGPTSPLGCPKSDEQTTPNGRGKFTTFDGGSIYWTSDTGAHPLWGTIGEKWGQLGWEGGALGFPKSDEFTNSDGAGKRQEYEGGTIYWHPSRSNGAHPVWGEIGEKWGAAGWENGPYGYPVTDEAPGLRPEDGYSQQFENGPIGWAPGEADDPQWQRAKAKHIDGSANPGDQAQSATLLPKGADRGIVLVRGFIADTTEFYDQIGEHRSFSTDPEAGAKGTFAWDTATGRVGIYIEHSCFQWVMCWDAKPLVRTQHAKEITDSNDIEQNEYWVEPYGNGGARIDVSLVNGFSSSGIPELVNFGRINATFWLTPREYDPDQVVNDTATFDVRTTKDKFPSWEVLRYPHLKPTSDAPEVHWLGRVGQTEIEDLKGVQHTCTRIGKNSDDPSMSCD
ncbi:LGFP repeat-containing protein [Streptomyces olivaceus]|uniref:LGFP repeat-containing protein n=1 Tax=Streptomyces olivaceus TaxID=47716 RepID=A0ABS7WE72_STROV|nr:hypothetical protein [Streptomyces olivaceus]MBZ6156260.1 hypothetical protein [Streptomyces olivaceus]MBZ6302912.1 hypothetical protein [Streptomyces olivaceus]